MTNTTRSLATAVMIGSLGYLNSAGQIPDNSNQSPDSGGGIPASAIPPGENPVGIDTKIFASDKEAYGHHLADVLSEDYYPEDEAKLTLFRNRTHNNGTASFKFTQEIAGLPVIYGDIVLHTNDQGVIYYSRGPVLRVEDDTNDVSPPSLALLNTVSSLLGGKTLDQIKYDSSCYFYHEDTDETMPGHVFYIDTRDGVNPDSKRIIVDAKKGTILMQSPLMIPALNRDIYDLDGGTTRPANPAREEGEDETDIPEVDDCYDSSGLTYDLFDDRFERDSWNGSGAIVEVEVRYGDEYEDNAWWIRPPTNPANFIRFGNGHGKLYDS